MNAPHGVILAGGRATRMGGGDKGLLQLDGRTLLHHVIERFSPQVEALALNANPPHQSSLAHFWCPTDQCMR